MEPQNLDPESNNSNMQQKSKRRINGLCRFRLKSDQLMGILVLAGVAVGITLGICIKATSPSSTTIILVSYPGELFMRMLKLLIIPITTTSIITGISNLDIKRSGKIGVRAMVYYVLTSALSTVVGVTLVIIIHPGNPSQNMGLQQEEYSKPVSVLDSYLDLFSNKTVNATEQVKNLRMVRNPNILGLIVFCIAFGLSLSKINGGVVASFFKELNDIFMNMIKVVLWLTPIGVCSLIAGKVLTMTNMGKIVKTLGMYVVTVMLGFVVHGLLLLPLIYWIFTRRNPYKFLSKLSPVFLTAFGTATSTGTLPVTIRCLENKIGVDKRITRFILPVGATMNMDGSAIMQTVATVMIAQMCELTLSFGQLTTVCVTATLTSIGAATVPSAGLVALLIVLTAVGLPTEPVALLWTIDWFVDRCRTTVNVFGDCVGAVVVEHLSRENLAARDTPADIKRRGNVEDIYVLTIEDES